MNTVTLSDGSTCSIGDYVCFKSDVEQSGKVQKIKKNTFGKVELYLTSENGFHGDYIGGSYQTVELASDCWKE